MTEFASKFNPRLKLYLGKEEKRKEKRERERERSMWAQKVYKSGRFHLVSKSSDFRDLKKNNVVATPLLQTLKTSM